MVGVCGEDKGRRNSQSGIDNRDNKENVSCERTTLFNNDYHQ